MNIENPGVGRPLLGPVKKNSAFIKNLALWNCKWSEDLQTLRLVSYKQHSQDKQVSPIIHNTDIGLAFHIKSSLLLILTPHGNYCVIMYGPLIFEWWTGWVLYNEQLQCGVHISRCVLFDFCTLSNILNMKQKDNFEIWVILDVFCWLFIQKAYKNI